MKTVKKPKKPKKPKFVSYAHQETKEALDALANFSVENKTTMLNAALLVLGRMAIDKGFKTPSSVGKLYEAQKLEISLSPSDIYASSVASGLWQSPTGATPAETLGAHIRTLIKRKGSGGIFYRVKVPGSKHYRYRITLYGMLTAKTLLTKEPKLAKVKIKIVRKEFKTSTF